MTDTPTEAEGTPPQELPFVADPNSDGLLSALVYLVNSNEGLELSITLHVHGAIVTGMLTSQQRYLAGMEEEAAAGGFAKFFSTISTAIQDTAKSATPRPLRSIHLRNARISLGQGAFVPSPGGAWWRGRIHEVDGFVLGTIEI